MLESQIKHLWGLFPPFENSKNSKYEFLVKKSHENTLKKAWGNNLILGGFRNQDEWYLIRIFFSIRY